MAERKGTINPMSLTVDELVSVVRKGGFRDMTSDRLMNDVSVGFVLNDDGTVDVFDYLTWLVGRRLSSPPPRMPPKSGFDMADVSPATLAGWLTMYNHIGHEVTKSRLASIMSTYRDSVCSKANESHFDFTRLLAFCVTHGRMRAKSVSRPGYEAHKAEMARRNREASAAGRDIGDIPSVRDADRRESCRMDFRLFCETYFPENFRLKWSDDHLKCISKIERSVLSGGLFALAMPRGSGKALALDTLLPTQSGWTTMGDVQVGDWLFDEQGHPCKVIRKSEVFTDHDCYRVSFSDGETIVCDAGHLWQVEDIYGRRNPYVRDTEWLASRYKIGRRGHHESRFRIPMQKPLQIQSSGELPIAPYALGVWLGDGTCSGSEITLFDKDAEEIAQNILKEPGNENLTVCDYGQKDHAVLTVLSKSVHRNREKEKTGQARLRKLGLLNNKHIPKEYLRADCSERLALLQGMLDTDGSADRNGHVEIVIKYSRLAEDFAELLSSLGIKFGMVLKTVMLDGKEYGPYHRFHFNGYRDQAFFKLNRKLERMRVRPVRRKTKTGFLSHTPCDVRMIVNIEKVPTVPTQCVMVDSPSHLYLAGRKMVPTHNSTLAETAAVWSMLYGHREFVCLVGSTETAALEMLDSIKTEIESNDMLYDDFPEVCFPISKLEGITSRANGQTCHGVRTRITWTANEIVLPSIEGSPSSGIIVRCAGITGRIRGMKFKRSDGRSVRPDLVIVDDPQTRDSARSLSQNRTREQILSGDILGLAGPGRKIAGIMPCTVIERGDMADSILDRDKHPEWNGERCKMLYAMPSHMELWEEYSVVMAESLRELGNISRATEFYLANRERMDEGAVVGWPERHNDDEASALQNAMNLMYRDAFSFASEYQNEPLAESDDSDRMLSADEIAAKVNGLDRRVVPLDCQRITMFIDVQKNCLFYTICAFSDDFTGSVIDYGTFPEQNTRRFTLATVTRRLCDVYKASVESQIHSGLSALVRDKASMQFFREDGAEMQIGLIAIDANWGISTDIVYQFCRQSEFRGRVIPAHGRYVGASSKPMTDYKRKPGERVGLNWIITNSASKRATRHIAFDTNFWKSFVQERLASQIGDAGCLSLYGTRPYEHELYSEHMTAEFRVKTQGRGRVVDEWKLRPDRSDNHWLDCTVGCLVLASSMGCSLPENAQESARRVISLKSIDSRTRETSHGADGGMERDANGRKTDRPRKRISLASIRRAR